MVQFWYPAAPADEHPPARYMEAGAAKEVEKGLELPDSALQDLRSHAHKSAPSARSGPYPVVLYSPGSGSMRAFGTALVEELASREYVVVTVDHTYDAAVVEFPGGRLVPAREPEIPKGADLSDLATWDSLTVQERAVRAADIRFVLDTLHKLQAGENPDAEDKPLPQHLAGTLDLSRIGVLGHSLGGSTAAQAMLEDLRIRASCILDGAIPQPVRKAGLDRPILLMRSEQPEEALAVDKAWKELHPRGWHRDLRLSDSGHLSFTDLPLFCAQLGATCPEQLRASTGSIDSRQSVDAQRAYTTAFFDQHLKGRRQPLLDRPSPRYPQVTFLP